MGCCAAKFVSLFYCANRQKFWGNTGLGYCQGYHLPRKENKHAVINDVFAVNSKFLNPIKGQVFFLRGQYFKSIFNTNIVRMQSVHFFGDPHFNQ